MLASGSELQVRSSGFVANGNFLPDCGSQWVFSLSLGLVESLYLPQSCFYLPGGGAEAGEAWQRLNRGLNPIRFVSADTHQGQRRHHASVLLLLSSHVPGEDANIASCLIAVAKELTKAVKGRRGSLWLTIQGCWGRHGGRNVRQLVAFTCKKQREMGPGIQLTFSFLLSL